MSLTEDHRRHPQLQPGPLPGGDVQVRHRPGVPEPRMVRRRRRLQGQQRRPDQEVREALRLVGQREGPQPPPRPQQGLREGHRRDLLLRQLRRPAPPRRPPLRREEVPGARHRLGRRLGDVLRGQRRRVGIQRQEDRAARSTGSCTTPSRRSPASGAPRPTRRPARSPRSSSGASTTSTGCACTSSPATARRS